MTCTFPVEYANPRSVAELAEPLRSRIAQAIADAPTGGLILVSGRRTDHQQWLLRHERCPGHECDPRVKGTPTTALPGRSHHRNTDPTHCAADMGGRDLPWLIANEHAYGLARTVPGERWHFEPRGAPSVPIAPFRPARPAMWLPIHPGDTEATIVARGGHDNEIAELQLRLAARGFYTGKIDGIHGPRTQAAVQSFKRWVIALQHATGQKTWPNDSPTVGPLTIAMLRWWTA